jgi:hypothetical protein
MTITRSQINQLARTGQLKAASRMGQQPQPAAEPKPPPSIGGTEIPAQKPEVRTPKHQWIGWEIELANARRRGLI